MKASVLFTCLGLSVALLGVAGQSRAADPGSHKSPEKQADDPKYKYHRASTLSGIDVRSDKKTGAFTLRFDQQLTETGILEVKNNADEVLFTRVLTPSTETVARNFDLGKLKPGIYSIEVKTSDTTFWKKIRIKP